MILIGFAVGIVLMVAVVVAVLLYIGKRVNDKSDVESNSREQCGKPIIVTVHSSKMRQALSRCRKHPLKRYGKGVLVSGKGLSLSQLIHTKKKAIKDRESAEKRKLIKQVSSGGRKKAFADEIEIARSVILRDAVDKKLPKPGHAKRERSTSIIIHTEPSDSKHVAAVEKGQSTTINIRKDRSRAGIVEKERSTVSNTEKTRSVTDNVKNEGSKLNDVTQNLPISSECETTSTVQGKGRSSDFVFTQAVIVGGTTRRAQLRKASEAGKVVKALSGRRESTLADDLKMGRSVILHERENVAEQHKTAENRKVIKRVTSNQERGNNSLQDNIQFAKSVILPNESTQSMDEKARDNRRVIQAASLASTGRRRSSLVDHIKFARSVINQPSASSVRGCISAGASPQDTAEHLSQQIREARSHGRRRSSKSSRI